METSTERREGKMNMQEMMEMLKTLGTPGAPHKLLAGTEGSWAAQVKTWIDPTKQSIYSTGTAERRMILDGRFLREEITSNVMGIVFNGIGFTGYDNSTKKYVSAWMDSSSTGIHFFEGIASEDGKTITLESPYYDDPIRGPIKWHSVARIVAENSFLFELYSVDKKGKEEKMMEVTYTRK